MRKTRKVTDRNSEERLQEARKDTQKLLEEIAPYTRPRQKETAITTAGQWCGTDSLIQDLCANAEDKNSFNHKPTWRPTF